MSYSNWAFYCGGFFGGQLVGETITLTVFLEALVSSAALLLILWMVQFVLTGLPKGDPES